MTHAITSRTLTPRVTREEGRDNIVGIGGHRAEAQAGNSFYREPSSNGALVQWTQQYDSPEGTKKRVKNKKPWYVLDCKHCKNVCQFADKTAEGVQAE